MTAAATLHTRSEEMPFVVDCHAHALPPEVLRAFQNWLEDSGTTEEGPPRLWSSPAFGSMNRQIECMNRTGIEFALLSHSSSTPAALHANAVGEQLAPEEMIRRANDESWAWEASSGGRLMAASWIDPRFPDSALEEVRRVAESPFTGILSMLTAYKDAEGDLRFLDHPEFEPVLALAAELDVPVVVHASTKVDFGRVGVPPLPGISGAYVTGGLSMMVENTLCLIRLVVSGVLDRHQGLRLLFGQLGGVFPFLAGRFDMIRELLSGAETATNGRSIASGRQGLLPNLREYTDRVYVDTHSMDGPALECALEAFGPHRVVFGSDYPVTPEKLGREAGISMVRNLGLNREERDTILGGTAAKLFGLPTAVIR